MQDFSMQMMYVYVCDANKYGISQISKVVFFFFFIQGFLCYILSLAKEGGKRTTLVSLFFFTFFCYIEKASKKRNTYKKLERTLKNYYSAEAFLNLNHHKKLYENKKKKKKSSSLLSMHALLEPS